MDNKKDNHTECPNVKKTLNKPEEDGDNEAPSPLDCDPQQGPRPGCDPTIIDLSYDDGTESYHSQPQVTVETNRPEIPAEGKKRKRVPDTTTEEMKDVGDTVERDESEEEIPTIDISKQDDGDQSSIPVLSALIIPEAHRAPQSETVTVRIKIRRTDGGLLGLSDLSTNMINAIGDRMATLIGTMEQPREEEEDDDNNGRNETTNEERTPLVDLTNTMDGSENTNRRSRTPEQHPTSDSPFSDYHSDQAGSISLVSPSTMPLGLKYLLLEELFMVDEVWNQMPKQVRPLSGDSEEKLTVSDCHSLVHHIFTRMAKKYSRLSAFNRMPMLDQMTLMKNKLRCASLTHSAISHRYEKGKVIVDYPGCQEISDDIRKRMPSTGYIVGELYPNRLRNDNTLTLILCAMALFDGDYLLAQEMSSAGEYRVNCENYCLVLKDYLISTYGEDEAEITYDVLTTWLNCVSMHARLATHRATFELEPFTFDVLNLQVPTLK